ncbi:MAG TPA: plastocyanin/azurin family copper-binding protein [Gemmatimonadaceae bacterium]|nr:plastocyanin/azurin family copper-binding protein [Gemmatimonadaceae bacterium]
MRHFTRRDRVAALVLGAALLALGCSGEGKREGGEQREHSEQEKKAEGGEGHGKVIVVEAYSDANGNYFKPADFEAHRGDTIRFTLKSGVHNVHFLPDSNPGRTGLPAASDLLQIPGQTYDLPITFAEGRYYYQCDPHAALGMKGHVKVED